MLERELEKERMRMEGIVNHHKERCHTYIYAYIHTYICTYVHNTYIYTYICIYIHT